MMGLTYAKVVLVVLLWWRHAGFCAAQAVPTNTALSVPPNTASGCPGGCWVPTLSNPRTCDCIKPVCKRDLNGDCNLCQRGWGVYSTKEACDAAGGPPAPPGVSRATYPRPKPTRQPLPTGRTQPSVAQGMLSCPTLPLTASNGQKGCPHSNADLTWWQDPSTWYRVKHKPYMYTLDAVLLTLLFAHYDVCVCDGHHTGLISSGIMTQFP